MIVITAATPWESTPFVKHWGLKPLRHPSPASGRGQGEGALTPTLSPFGGEGVGLAFCGQIAGQEVAVVRTGIGAAKTAAALSKLSIPKGDLIAVSSGLCGALQPGIACGDIVADLREAPIEAVEAAREGAKSLGLGFHAGAFHTAEKVETAPEAKRELGSKLRAVAVDMESRAVKDWCLANGGWFVTLRAVLDTVDDRLPEATLEDDSLPAMVRFGLAHWKDAPLLIRLGSRQRKAMRGLVPFLERWIQAMAIQEASSLSQGRLARR